jgi:hypothetical protein
VNEGNFVPMQLDNAYHHSPGPDGEGSYKWADGGTYTGSWQKGLRHGEVIRCRDTTLAYSY